MSASPSLLRRTLRARVRLPLLRRVVAVPAVLVVLLVFAVAIAGGVGLKISNEPLFCISCHEMSVHYATWRQSGHKDVKCEECHVMPGLTNMAKTKFAALRQIYLHQKGNVKTSAIQGHVPDANCKRCHPETRDLIVYHSLKITHAKHWKMGVSCTFCHDRVVHGPRQKHEKGQQASPIVRVGYKYTPTMQTCYKCHDGKKAPNTCSTCHTVLGERRPTAFDPAWVEAHKEEIKQRGDTCESCHSQDFCRNCHSAANPHSREWVSRHAAQFKQSPDSCKTCHQTQAEREAGDSISFCADCHSLKREHKGTDWLARHQVEFRADPNQCDRCHQKKWCQDCHQTYRSHPPYWRQSHPASAKSKPESCQVCHASYFCIACHRGKGDKAIPASHSKPNWLKQHKVQVEQKASQCSTCHKTEFCMACHRRSKPESHGSDWTRLHGAESQRNMAECMACHEKSACLDCHKIDIPHPKNWQKEHHGPAKNRRHVCQTCHKQEYCNGCHRGTRPTSHDTGKWEKTHGRQAASGKTNCTLCHTTRYCDTCHGMKMPHPKGFANQHPPRGQDAAMCGRCHESKFCSDCHKTQVPHPAGWVEIHSTQAQKQPQICRTCHTSKKRSCTACHKGTPPSDHNKEWKKTHASAGKAKQNLCELCHGQQDVCNSCHGGIKMPHPKDWTMQHKAQASLKPGSVCFRCHDRATFCANCHGN